MNKFLFIFLLSISGISFAEASELPINNAGFVQSNIWYSKDPFYIGEKVRIYTVIFNGSTYDLSGSVEFLDNGNSLGKTNFSLSGSGRAQDLWIDWKASGGVHTITARLVDVIADGPNGKQPAALTNAETGKSERLVDLDPVAKEAQAKLEVQKVAEAGTRALSKVDDVVQMVKDVIPAPIQAEVLSGANAVEQFRLGEGYQLRLAKEQKSRDIDAMNAHALKAPAQSDSAKKDAGVWGTVSNTAEKPFAYVMLASLAMLQFAFDWRVVFYGVILYVLYRSIKWGIHKVRNR